MLGCGCLGTHGLSPGLSRNREAQGPCELWAAGPAHISTLPAHFSFSLAVLAKKHPGNKALKGNLSETYQQ